MQYDSLVKSLIAAESLQGQDRPRLEYLLQKVRALSGPVNDLTGYQSPDLSLCDQVDQLVTAYQQLEATIQFKLKQVT
jgi:hypothetical protein